MPEADGAPRDPEEVREQLDDLRRVARKARTAARDDFASAFAIQHLEEEKRHLLNELSEARLHKGEIDADLRLDGASVEDHAAPMELIGKFLAGFQKLHFSIAQVELGEPTSRAPIPGEITEDSKLMVKGFSPGSFSVQVKVSGDQTSFGTSLDPQERVLDRLIRTLESDTSHEDLAEFLSHSRVNSHYTNLIDLLVHEDIGLTVRSRVRSDPVKISSDMARDRSEWLERLEVEESEKIVEGILVGGSTDTDKFEIESDGEVIRGKITDQVRSQLRGIALGTLVRAIIVEEITRHEQMNLDPKVQLTAKSIESLE